MPEQSLPILVAVFIISSTGFTDTARAGLATVRGNAAIGRFLNGFCDNSGTFYSDRLIGTVPMITADVVQGPSRRHFRPYVYVADMDRDGIFELVYFKDITNPLHIETRIYRLTSLSAEQARDLVEKKAAGRYFGAIMANLSDTVRFEYGGTIGNLKPIALNGSRYFSGPKTVRNESLTYRNTPFNTGGRNYILIERLNAPDTRLAVVEAESLEREKFRLAGEYIVTPEPH
jgi:hypothetical protein